MLGWITGMAKQSTSRSLGEAESMDARLWGGLQSHVDLKMIYAKLPIGDFFRLRQVCKDWNRLASDPAFLLENWRDPIASPYFVVDSLKTGHPRLLTYKASSWSWTRLPPMKCEVAGMLLCKDSNCVFNVHTRVFHSLPPLEEDEEDDEESLIGMVVDSPSSFQVILSDQYVGTRIYDSKCNSWTYRSSIHEFSTLGLSFDDDKLMPKPTSVYFNGLLHIRAWTLDQMTVDLHTYNAERDEWQVGEPWIPGETWMFCDVGVWQNRLFLFRMEDEPCGGISAWENCGESESEGNWTLYDRMPEDLCEWMLDGWDGIEAIEMQGKFCGEYVLVYNCAGGDEVTERAVLYNLDQKTWERVELPNWTFMVLE